MERLSARAEKMLSDIIAFWQGLRDDDFGGYYGYVGQDLKVDKHAVKGCILNSRILWFFSEAAILTNRSDLRNEAQHAFEFILSHCLDKINGGVFWSLTFDGCVFDDTKHTYNQAFAIYALSSYFKLTGNQLALKTALSIFDKIENTCRDDEGYLEAFSCDWRVQSNEKLSENGVLADKTMNTLLHVFEGYSNLYTCTHSKVVSEAMRRCIAIYSRKIYDPIRHQQKVFFDSHYNSILDICSYGHDIEASWLFDEGSSLLNDEMISSEIIKIDNELAKAVYEKAYKGNSVVNECECGVVDETRIWWVQAEAVVGFVNLFQKCGEEKYSHAAANILEYIQNYLIDKRDGSEWFWCLNKDKIPIPEKPIVEPWKCPYHNGRMCMELIRRNPEIYV